MFQIGDNIVYPMQGAGIIKAIEEKEVLGEKRQYFIIKMSNSNMEIMIPTSKVLSSGIRPVIDIIELTKIIEIFQHGESDDSLLWKQRYKLNTEKIKTGNLQDSAEVVRDLLRLKKENALNESEKKLLQKAQEFLISELQLVDGITNDQLNFFC